MTDQKMDFTALDPSQDAERWERLVESVASRAVAARRRRVSLAYQLTVWMRPALAIAAAAAVLSWVGALTSARTGSTVARQTDEHPAFVLSRWAMADERPSTKKILQVLGGQND